MIQLKKCQAAFFVLSAVVRFLFVSHLLLVFFHDQPIHDADVPGTCPGKHLPLFVKIMIILAKIETIITQGSELPHVGSFQYQAASFSTILPIMAGHLEEMVGGINAAKDCPQKILLWDKAQCPAIILSDQRQ